jgi:hypothetical protein
MTSSGNKYRKTSGAFLTTYSKPSPENAREQKDASHLRAFVFDIGQEIANFFDDSSSPVNGQPELVLILGAVCTGKTTVRKQQYSKGYVLIDAAEIFLSLSNGEYFDFGFEPFEQPMEIIGGMVARQAIFQRRNIVTEMTVSFDEEIKAVIEAMRGIDYKVQITWVNCDLETAKKRNLNRGDDDISAWYTQLYHQQWVRTAAKEYLEECDNDLRD